MFICTECGLQYKNKPQYCDCGNDEFQELATRNITTILKERFDRIGISVYSLLFLFVCVLLSFFILFCFNPMPKNNTQISKNTTKSNVSIPSIDKLWVESTLKQDNIKVEKTPIINTTPISTSKQIVKKVVTKNNSKKTTTKSQTVVKEQAKKSPTTNNTIKKTQVSTPTNTIKPKNIEKPKIQTPVKTVQKTVTNQNAKKNNQELYNYKLQLRQALFAKLSVVSIQGSGNCGIEFSIDSSGKLINRNFTYQSDNKSVNDEVYKMLMRLPKYYPPPSGYNGEKIKMIFSFDNGSYSINYTN